MIESTIPQNILKHKSKFIANMTVRQVVSAGIGIPFGIFIHFRCLSWISSEDIQIFLTGVVILPFLLAGFVEIYGQPFEKIAVRIVLENFIYPAWRKKETGILEKEKLPEEEEEKKIQASEKYKAIR